MSLTRVKEQCANLEKRLQTFVDDRKALDVDSLAHPVFLGLLAEACNLLRAADAGDKEYPAIMGQINETINKAIELGYKRVEFDFMPSFAHSNAHPALEGPYREKGVFSHRMKDALRAFVAVFAKKLGEEKDKAFSFPPPWDTTPRLHPLSSALSRFDVNFACPPQATPLLNCISQARCEISSDRVSLPITLVHSRSCIALPSMGGYKNRTPQLSYYLLDHPAADSGQDFPLDVRCSDVGLRGIGYSAAIDEERKLIFVADDDRVKSYVWASQSGEIYKSARPAHTLDSSTDGPLAVLPGGRFVRAGKGLVEAWNIDELETHGADGKTRIGTRYSAEDSWRDDDDEVENSAGSKPSATVSFADKKFAPETWEAHPSVSGTMLCGTDPDKSHDYSCVSLDLEHGGKAGMRYVGAGGKIESFSTSAGDPSQFLTAASDGYARLYDVRIPLPVLSLAAGFGETSCAAALLVHPDGVPMIFMGAEEDEVIRVWDARAQKLLYELSTGNNQVTGLAWDSERSVLYASTQCDYMDRNGYTMDYRRAKIPRARDKRDDEGDDDEDDNDYPRCWPKKAAHGEEYFGHILDAGEHRIFRYAFKEQPDPMILPVYGDATIGDSMRW
ncbi:hypothetical protein K438DRAFT_1991437 [Mycena galopus ATCC 62051]|nr:hypothetical protein K438DRAFT_1991437 [Mycena galopus ATCC 62051]